VNNKPDYGFTPREKDVLRLLVEGLKNEAIANILHISISTVKVNLTNIFEKLNVENRTKAVAKILEENITLHQG
jgi:DNA-binding NarL/FixJ family response regulator